MNGQTMIDRGINQSISKKLKIRIGGKYHLAIITALDNVLRLVWDNVTGKASHKIEVYK
jgi:hypothetical protein